MEITNIAVYGTELSLREEEYHWSGDRSISTPETTIVEVETDEGVSGYGEVCPLGSTYLPAFRGGVRAGLDELSPALIGVDPTRIGVVSRRMDRHLRGHPYVKSPIDIACWDILGKVADLPVSTLLGGRIGDDIGLYRAISQGSSEAMATTVAKYRDHGYEVFQLKVGGAVESDIDRVRATAAELDTNHVLVADANMGWTQHEAVRFVNALRDVDGDDDHIGETDVYVEQPCETYAGCLAVREQTTLPMVLDEVLDGMTPILQGYQDGAMDVVNLKIAKLGGLTRARQVRDLCVELGLAMNIEDTFGSDIATATIAHLAHSTPPAFRFAVTHFDTYVTERTAEGGPPIEDGRTTSSMDPGLGVTPRFDRVGDPVATYP